MSARQLIVLAVAAIAAIAALFLLHALAGDRAEPGAEVAAAGQMPKSDKYL